MHSMTASDRLDLNKPDEISHAERPKLRGRPRKDHSPIIDADILKAAGELFGELGYRATSMEAVALKVGIAKRTLYVRYPDKVSLFKDVVTSIIGNAKTPEPRDFPDLRTCLTFHTENYFIIASHPSMRVIRALGDVEVQAIPELNAIGQELTRDIGIKPIAQTISDTAKRAGIHINDPDFISASLLDMASGHYNRVTLLNLRSDFASFKFASERIVNLLLAGIIAASPKT
jgi:TetR/AcrR family transcriptional repressor of mexJK operon